MVQHKWVSMFSDRHGKPRWRFRRRGRPTYCFQFPPGTKEFEEEYAACVADQVPHNATPTTRDIAFAQQGRPMVYFIGAIEGPIKIGTSTDIIRRLRALQSSHPEPLYLFAADAGGSQKERAYHTRFAKHRLTGEWFARAPEILAEIRSLHWRTGSANRNRLARQLSEVAE